MKGRFWIFVLAVFLAACGGGGGGGGSTPVAAASGSGDGAVSTGGGQSDSTPAASMAAQDLVRGRITGFGSVYIDGKRFDTSEATFSKDDDAATQDDLSIGMVVELRGDIQAGTASAVRFEEDIKGPLDAIDRATSVLTVLGQTVQLTAETRFDDSFDLDTLAVGDVLQVSGLRGGDDVLEASHIEEKVLSDVNSFKVIGQVRELDSSGQAFRVGGLLVRYAAAQLDDGVQISEGATVEVKDENRAYNPGDFTLNATKVEQAGFGLGAGNGDDAGTTDSDRPPVALVQLEGLLSNLLDATKFELAGTIVNHGSTTQFVFGDASLLAVGTKVQVEGALADDGSITAAKIKFSRNSARLDGRVELIDLDAMQLSILGVLVSLDRVAAYEDKRDDEQPFGATEIRAGDFLEVRGNAAGQMVFANEVEREDDGDTRLRGAAADADAETGTLTVLGVAITTSANTRYEGRSDEALTASAFFSALADGQTLVAAKWDGTVTDASVPVQELSLED